MRRPTEGCDSIGGTHTAVILAFNPGAVVLCQVRGATIAQISTYPAHGPEAHEEELARCIQVHDPFQKYLTTPSMRAKIFAHYEKKSRGDTCT